MNAVEQRRLFSVQGIVIASVLGSLAAGTVLMVLNYVALGSRDLAKKTAWGGVLAYLLVVGLAAVLPIQARLIVGTLVQGLLAWFLADRLQGSAIAWHVEQGGDMHSNFRAAGVALLVALVLLFVMTFLVVLAGGVGRAV